MSKIIPFSAILVLIPLAAFCVDVQLGPLNVKAFEGQPHELILPTDPGQPICRAITNQSTLEILTKKVEKSKVILTKQLFEPVLVGKNEIGELVLVGKFAGEENLKVLPLKDIQSFVPIPYKRFQITEGMISKAAGMVSQVVCAG